MASAVQSCDAACCLATCARSASTSAAAADATAAAAAAVAARDPPRRPDRRFQTFHPGGHPREFRAQRRVFFVQRKHALDQRLRLSLGASRRVHLAFRHRAKFAPRFLRLRLRRRARRLRRRLARALHRRGNGPKVDPRPGGRFGIVPLALDATRLHRSRPREHHVEGFRRASLETAAFVEGSDESDSENPTGDAAAAAASSAATVPAGEARRRG